VQRGSARCDSRMPRSQLGGQSRKRRAGGPGAAGVHIRSGLAHHPQGFALLDDAFALDAPATNTPSDGALHLPSATAAPPTHIPHTRGSARLPVRPRTRQGPSSPRLSNRGSAVAAAAAAAAAVRERPAAMQPTRRLQNLSSVPSAAVVRCWHAALLLASLPKRFGRCVAARLWRASSVCAILYRCCCLWRRRRLPPPTTMTHPPSSKMAPPHPLTNSPPILYPPSYCIAVSGLRSLVGESRAPRAPRPSCPLVTSVPSLTRVWVARL